MQWWKSLRRNEKQFLMTCVAPLLLILAISLVVMVAKGLNAASFAMMALMTIWMVSAVGYVLFDSRSRWPGLSPFERFANLVTFKR